MKAICLAAALLISGAAVTTASAAPAAPMKGVTQGHVIDVQYRHRDDRRYRRHVRPVPRYRAGHRYHSAPHGWHRHHARPRDWNRRGCIMVGPMWFCP